MKIGFIGTGIITSSVVEGLCKCGRDDISIMVSPRNKDRAKKLKEMFPDKVTVAENNQQVVDFSEWLFLAVLPSQGEDVLAKLTIPAEVKFVNLVSTLSLEKIEELTGKREVLADVVPLTFAANGFGPTVVYPNIPEVCEIMELFGTAVAVDTKEQIAVLRALTGLMSPYYMLLTKMIHWCVSHGLEEPEARAYVTEFTGALSKKAATFPEDLEELAREATPGGLNWTALTHIEEAGAYDPWMEILEPILKRVEK